ncbi:MAG: phosphoribosylaminoimidazolesuccinocarboxamide synthase [Peptococcaceae bacterium]|nr:phosphoribosylaminoimidazolesuccinocarboxamide synthase [Peptococcaceae bacterium]MBP3625256.1 phosphoribosylaminoimidazolesuccinocarboxamide synthase [Peptococcaceae bacterium]
MQKMKLLYEGKAKKVFQTDMTDVLIVSYKDDATAFNGEKKGTIAGKGIVNNRISNHFFKLLERNGIPTHYIEDLNNRETAVKQVEIVPLEVIVRNVAAGSFSRKMGVAEGTVLSVPTIEFSYKNDALGDPFINSSYAVALQLATQQEIKIMKNYALQINEILKEEYARVNLQLVDFKIEFGRYHDAIILADEISPDTCRLWDMESGERMDKDRFRRDLGGVEEAYQQVALRLGCEDMEDN